jgi:hypothetical protein
VRLTIWQFVGLVVIGVGAYLIYAYWWVDQDRNSWINRMNKNIYSSEDELKETEPVEDPNAGWI